MLWLGWLFSVAFPRCGAAFPADTSASSPPLVFISDTQAPRWGETLLLKTNHNEAATAALLRDIPRLSPDAVFFLGDVVNLSRKERRWQHLDSTLAAYRSAGIPVHACLGNHELMGNSEKGERNFQRRFPGHTRTGYVVVTDSVAVILLNSNISKMDRTDVERQRAWYARTLDSLEHDPATADIIVCCHHAPYSDSRMVGCSREVQEDFVPGFLRTGKARLFLSGHAHLFQHFRHEGKDFVVLGGGGGLAHPLRKKCCTARDLAEGYKPPFHYLTVTRVHGRLQVVSRRLDEPSGNSQEALMFEIPPQ